ncbi:phosphotransferase [Streptomyces sp. L7]
MALRKPPEKVPPGRNETMLREYRVLKALNGTDVPHPEAIAVCDDTSVLGSCFYLMAHVDGWSPMNSGGWPEPFLSDLSLRPARVPTRRGHRQVGQRGLGGPRALRAFGRPDRFHDRQVDRWLAHLAKFQSPRDTRPGEGRRLAAGTSSRPLDTGHHPRRLPVRQRHVPARRTGRTRGPGRLRNGHRGRPVARPRLGDHAGSAGRRRGPHPEGLRRLHPACPTAPTCWSTTPRSAGGTLGEIDYYVILARFKMAVVLEGGCARHVKGEGGNPEMAHYGDVVPCRWPPRRRELAATDPAMRAARCNAVVGGPGGRRGRS